MALTKPGPKPARRVRRIVVGALVILVLLAAGAVWFNEYLSYNEDISTCYSDNMWALKDGLEDYCREHGGKMPAVFDELRAYMKGKKGGPYDICVRAGKPFVWMPEGVTADDGRPVILMCPPDSHGWLRRYAFGLVRDGDTFVFVRVRSGRATAFRP